jgi:hypothetical protein
MALTSRPSPLPRLAPLWSPARLERVWPLPALLVWGAAWLCCQLLQSLALPGPLAFAAAALLGVLASLLQERPWRRLIVAAGFPLSAVLAGLTGQLASGAAGSPAAWLWLLPLALLALAYPARAWRDAPFFPTPTDALAELPEVVTLPAQAAVLDLGCGAGHGLQALHAAYPQARLHGIEWSWLLRWLAAWRCRWARVRQGDMWTADWSSYQLVYLFQRPESMERAVQKARAEMLAGSWLVSLEFQASGLQPHAVLRPRGGKPVWVYRLPGAEAARTPIHSARRPGQPTPIRRIV